ncbi:MAG: hypothetical protein GY855_06925, partial [candidate division Zixibacteria bacterium]|nr:hypothetical protein [candidate division Zixibacteria bacterium]
RGFFYSLAIPGVGEYYAESKYKPYIFFSADVLLWSGYFLYNKKGRDKEDEYKAYADIHYDRTYYDDWWNFIIGLNPNTDTASTYSHRLPAEKDHEYYENIGKYDQFRWGWDDWISQGHSYYDNVDPSLYRTANRNTYLEIRKDANDNFDRAKTLMVVSMVNHIVSAFDAAFTVKAYNRRNTSPIFSNVKIRMEPKFYGTDLYPQLTFYKGF